MKTRGTLSLAMIAALSAQAAHADLFTDAQAQALAAQPYNSNGASLINVHSTMANGQGAPAPASWNGMYADSVGTPGAGGNALTLPQAVQPWAWSWFPMYQCSLVYWRPTTVGPVSLSPLEKLDTFANSNGQAEPFAAGFESCDARPWVAQQRNLPAGHNLTRAYAESGNQTKIPWQGGQSVDVGWWGHCNGWAAAAVSFPEAQLPGRYLNLQKNAVRFLNRPEFGDTGQDGPGRGGGLIGLYQEYPAQQMYMYTEDIKSILCEYGMQLKPNPTFSAGRRYDSPSADVSEYFYDRRADGSVVIPQDATLLWVALIIDGQTVGGWQVPKGYPEAQLQQWRSQIEQYYKYYYQGRQVYTQCTARYSNLPMAPTEDDLASMPSLPRKEYLDCDPLDFHAKVTAAFAANHGLIAEVSPGAEIWNFPVMNYAYNFTDIYEVPYNQGAQFVRGASGDASSLYNLYGYDASRLAVRGNQRVLRYRVGAMQVTLTEVSQPTVKNYQFFAFYDGNNASIGSAWAGASLTDHPDFCWYPDLDNPGIPSAGNPYVHAADLKVLLPGLPIR